VYCEDYARYFTVILPFLAFYFCSSYFIYLVSCNFHLSLSLSICVCVCVSVSAPTNSLFSLSTFLHLPPSNSISPSFPPLILSSLLPLPPLSLSPSIHHLLPPPLSLYLYISISPISLPLSLSTPYTPSLSTPAPYLSPPLSLSHDLSFLLFKYPFPSLASSLSHYLFLSKYLSPPSVSLSLFNGER
jgi:hypothetical protein